MEQIILSTNLRFVIAGLNATQKGELFQALLEQNGDTLAGEVQNIYHYIIALQQELTEKKRRMKELSEKAVAVRKKAAQMDDLFEETPSVTDGAPTVNRANQKRKEAKENNLNINKKIKKIFISATEKKEKGKKNAANASALKPELPEREPFVPPLAEDVRVFVEEEGLCVNPEEFVDFYDSHGWMVGTTAIKNWKATVRLWHRRCANGGGGQSCPPLPASPSKGGGGLKSEPFQESGGAGGTGGQSCPPLPTSPSKGGGGNAGGTGGQSCPPLPASPSKGGGGNAGGLGGLGARKRKNDDETYWHELMEKTRAVTNCPATKPPEQAAESVDEGDENALPDYGLSPFARFMRRIEDNDV